MPVYTASIAIAAPPQTIYERVADIATHGTWSADRLEVAMVDPDHFRSSVTKGKTVGADITVVERVPPTRFVFDVRDPTGQWRHTFTIAPAGEGSTLTREIAGTLRGAQLVLYWLVVQPIKKPNSRRALERLKELVENSTQR